MSPDHGMTGSSDGLRGDTPGSRSAECMRVRAHDAGVDDFPPILKKLVFATPCHKSEGGGVQMMPLPVWKTLMTRSEVVRGDGAAVDGCGEAAGAEMSTGEQTGRCRSRLR